MDVVKPEADRMRRRLNLLEIGIPLTLIAKSEGISRQAVHDWANRHDYLDHWREKNNEVGYNNHEINFVYLVLGRLGRLLRAYVQELSNRNDELIK